MEYQLNDSSPADLPLSQNDATLVLRGASKTFNGIKVLDNVDFDLWPGSVHGIVGMNGSGKSTLIKVLAGYHAPDDGAQLFIRSDEISLPLSPSDPGRYGMAFVHQDLGLIEDASVTENICVGTFPTLFGSRIDWKSALNRSRSLLSDLGVDIDPGLPVHRLTSSVERVLVAIARALATLSDQPNGLLILDEASAFLPYGTAQGLIEAVRRIARAGLSIAFVGHDLDEILGVADIITILRDGRRVARVNSGDVTRDRLFELIVGTTIASVPVLENGESSRPVRLRAHGLNVPGCVVSSLEFCGGEVTGLTGLPGSGYETVPSTLLGLRKARSGTIQVDADSPVSLSRMSPRRAMDMRIGFVPGDRARQGAVGSASAIENATILQLPRLTGFLGGLRKTKESDYTERLMEDFHVRPPNPLQLFSRFSGGNQQKMVLGRWLALDPRVLVLDEPTRGVDVRARQVLHARIRELAEQRGVSVVMLSGDYDELATVCDRVVVFRAGAVAADLRGQLSSVQIAEECYGASSPQVSFE